MAIIKDGVLIKAEDSDIINGVFTAPPSVKVIGPNALENLDSLVEVNLPGNVIGIGAKAFSSCRHLSFVTATNNLLVVGEEAFANCPKLLTFVLNEEDEYKEEEPFSCNGSQFIKLFGYYEKLTDEYKAIKALESSVPSESNFDWFGASEISKNYPLYSGIYRSAFAETPKIQEIQIPNKMSVLGEKFVNECDFSKIKDLKNIVKLYSTEICLDNNSLVELWRFKNRVDSNIKKVRDRLTQEPIEEIKKTEEKVVYEIPEKTKFWRNLFKSKKSTIITFTPTAVADSSIPTPSGTFSEEKLESLLKSRISMLQFIEPAISDYFKAQFDAASVDNPYLTSRRAKLSALYDNFSVALSIIQTKSIKDTIEKSDVNEPAFKKYCDVLLKAREDLLRLKNELGSKKLYEELKERLYSTIYLMIKQELRNFGTNELYDKMNSDDRYIMLPYCSKDIAPNTKLAAEYLDIDESLLLTMIKKYFEASGIRLNFLSGTDVNRPKLYKINLAQSIKLEGELPVAQPFSM